MIWLAIAAGGALGAVARYAVNLWLYPVFEQRVPLPTLMVNLVGSALMGVAYVWLIERGSYHPVLRHLLMTGFLGAFTTFSAFSLDAFSLMRNGATLMALGYVLLSVTSCIIAVSLAIKITSEYL
ncbi:fluoride efflux transporter CrcB [Simiduia sp. 21SJ11W-1]|uniref:fluoride efflux transporter CrcB n=1 Tax=Simiduia sp. 21SJ11W-1 TaxID=2909669 RepID=UPI0020A12B14|nr:fluoride efflux transporter CrcB [Simiduia sp. 21SJ11W-1]UTA49576.1 fluoride efflux transporter CrcB [Simiduia sp. 21SJ11W-1]